MYQRVSFCLGSLVYIFFSCFNTSHFSAERKEAEPASLRAKGECRGRLTEGECRGGWGEVVGASNTPSSPPSTSCSPHHRGKMPETESAGAAGCTSLWSTLIWVRRHAGAGPWPFALLFDASCFNFFITLYKGRKECEYFVHPNVYSKDLAH